MRTINHISDLLPAVEGRKDFVVLEKDGYTVIDYVYLADDSFADPRRLECRGIKFCSETGDIIARPFHKFFNVGEKEQPEDIDLGRAHVVLEKLDGSMIHPTMVNGSLHLMTRKGRSDVALQAEGLFLSQPKYFMFCHNMVKDGWTPIFEYTGPKNRIVLQYDEPALTLLAIRHIENGVYLNRPTTLGLAEESGIPMVGLEHLPRASGMTGYLAHTRTLEDAEGYVIQFSDGHMLKMKAEDYLLKHRALDDMSSKKKVLALVMDGFEDDVIPALGKEDADELKEFALQVRARVRHLCTIANGLVDDKGSESRKSFAIRAGRSYPGHIAAMCFAILDGKDPMVPLRKAISKDPDILGVPWRGV